MKDSCRAVLLWSITLVQSLWEILMIHLRDHLPHFPLKSQNLVAMTSGLLADIKAIDNGCVILWVFGVWQSSVSVMASFSLFDYVWLILLLFPNWIDGIYKHVSPSINYHFYNNQDFYYYIIIKWVMKRHE